MTDGARVCGAGVLEGFVGELCRASRRRGREGIGLPAATWQELAVLAERFGVPLPDCRST